MSITTDEDDDYFIVYPKRRTIGLVMSLANLTSLNAQPTTFSRTTSAYDPYNNTIKLVNQRRQRPITVGGTTYQADLIEINRTNLVAAGTGEHFERMTAGSGSPTITADVVAAPNGETVADSLVEGSGTGLHSVSQNINKAASALDYTVSVYIKNAVGTRHFRLQVDDGTTSNGVYITVSPVGGTLVTAPTAFGTGWSVTTIGGTNGYTITDAGSGWNRITLSATSSATTTIRVLCAMENTGTISYAGDSTSGVYLWGLQLEQAAFPTSTILNRNMALSSEGLTSSTWTKTRSSATANVVADPLTGNLTADKLTEDNTASSTHVVTTSAITKAAASLTFTTSVYAKAAERTWILLSLADNASANSAGAYFDLGNGVAGSNSSGGAGFTLVSKSITSVGNGWYRCVVTVTSDTSTTIRSFVRLSTGDTVSSYSGDGVSGVYLFGSQVEYGTTATSYWATSATAGQRTADDMTVAFTPSATQGTVYGVIIPNLWSVSPSVAGQAGTTTALSGITTNTNLLIQVTPVGIINFGRGDAGGTQPAQIASALVNRAIGTLAGSWDTTSVNVWHNCALGTPDTTLNPPYAAETSLSIGNLTGSARYIDGWVWFGYSDSVLPHSHIQILHANTSAP